MAYWITTHYPHPVPDTAPWHIYFRKKPQTYPSVGDLVLFYETFEPQADRKAHGRKAVVGAAVVTGDLCPMSGIGPWVHQIPCAKHRSGMAVPLDIARQIIPGPFYRQTLRRLTESQYKQIAVKMGVWS